MDTKTKRKEGPGRPVSKIELNFNQLDQTLTKVLEVCGNDRIRGKVLVLCDQILSNLVTKTSTATQTKDPSNLSSSIATQTNCDPVDADSILSDIATANLPESELDYLF